MQKASRRAADLMRALASENRLMLLCQLAQGEKSVGALAEALDLRQSTVSQQLALLRKDGLVTTRREAQTVHYSLAGDDARRVIEVLYALYCAPVARAANATVDVPA
ncbi:MAG: metalloregulator ArsR/SmtB family transcription factor [Alphaproteobacteria bacterium]